MRRLLLLVGIVLSVLGGSGGLTVAGQVETEVEAKLLLVLRAVPADGATVAPELRAAAARTVERRVEALGIADAEVWLSGGDQIVVELPGVNGDQADQIGRQLTASALLEFIDPQGAFLPEGTVVITTLGGPTDGATPATDTVYQTIVSGSDLKGAHAAYNALNQPVVAFELADEAAERFYEYTSNNIRNPLSIVLDKRVVSTPVINGAIRNEGIIEGVEPDQVDDLIVQLNSGALPVPLRVMTSMVLAGIPASAGTPVSR